ncbi:hypothetical protein [Kitasatospora sp. MBT63]|uniref:hypothetical protein n=1 Tax=Kitasatospora sp. MBT63 TaxID=1444768 RepID=UPI000539624F|nr:hypothetical protein [Kitasatospora sp. MBT63]
MNALPHPPQQQGDSPDGQPSDRELAAALAAGTVLLELPYRGHCVQAVSTDFGVFGRRDVFGCLGEIAPHTMNQWTRFPDQQAATAWCRNVLAESLYRVGPAGVGRHFAVWQGTGWAAEIDLDRQRYTFATGTPPAAAYDVLDAREDADEPLTAVEARGWAWLLDRMPDPVSQWPRSMTDEYLRRVLMAGLQ